MYVRRIHLENIKTFRDFVWQLEPDEDPAGWHVLLGDNGSGKTTFVRAVAYTLIGVPEAMQLRANAGKWISSNSKSGTISIQIALDSQVDAFTMNKNVSGELKNLQITHIRYQKGGLAAFVKNHKNNNSFHLGRDHQASVVINEGWFSAAYGPYRRFTGGNQEYETIFKSSPPVARHLSAFGEDIALTETLEWLMALRFRELESNEESSQLLKNIFQFVNQDDFLPNNVQMKQVTSEGITFIDAGECEIDINALSDGYRSILSMTLELIRQMVACYGTSDIFDETGTMVTYPGVVLIDEIDVHLHPTWQRKIGDWFTKHFPRIQFIVTTHSAFVCQSAVNGSIWRLPNPGDSDDKGERITGAALNRLLYGNLLEAYSSGAFGMEVNRSDDAQVMLDELADLNVKAMFEPLNDAEQTRRAQLQGTFNTTPQITKNGGSAP